MTLDEALNHPMIATIVEQLDIIAHDEAAALIVIDNEGEEVYDGLLEFVEALQELAE